MLSRLRVSDLARPALTWAISSLGLIVADGLLSGLEALSPWRLVMAAAVTGVFGVLIRPVLVKVATAIGWLAVAAIAIAGQAVVMHFALKVVPGVETSSFWILVVATWVTATISTILTWLVTAGSDDAFTTALRRFGGKGAVIADPEVAVTLPSEARLQLGRLPGCTPAQVPTGNPPSPATSSSSARAISVWSMPESRKRLMREDIDERWPRLISGLAASPGIGSLP